jgi:hypothetical protein
MNWSKVVRVLVSLGPVWIDGMKRNGAERNIIEWSGAERNGTQFPFHCLGYYNRMEQICHYIA